MFEIEKKKTGEKTFLANFIQFFALAFLYKSQDTYKVNTV